MEESSSTTSRKCPKKNLFGGFGNYCCVPGCKSAFYDKSRENTNISLFTIPKREDLRKKWLNVLNHIRRKGGGDSFDVKNPNKRIYVCEFYFKDEDLTATLGRGKKKVKARRVPSIFREEAVKQKATRPPPKNWLTSFVESETESDEVLPSSSSSSEKEPSESYVKEACETERLIEEINQVRKKIMNVFRKRTICCLKKINYRNCRGFLSKTCVKIKNNFVVLLLEIQIALYVCLTI